MQIKAFKAWCARPDLAAKVAAVPYDVVNTEEAKILAAGNPYSFLHVSRAEIDMQPGVDPYSTEVYIQGRNTLNRFQAEGVLRQEATPQFFLYRQTMGKHVQRGIVACCSTVEYEKQIIKILLLLALFFNTLMNFPSLLFWGQVQHIHTHTHSNIIINYIICI